jgi:hypothetical protein
LYDAAVGTKSSPPPIVMDGATKRAGIASIPICSNEETLCRLKYSVQRTVEPAPIANADQSDTAKLGNVAVPGAMESFPLTRTARLWLLEVGSVNREFVSRPWKYKLEPLLMSKPSEKPRDICTNEEPSKTTCPCDVTSGDTKNVSGTLMARGPASSSEGP